VLWTSCLRFLTKRPAIPQQLYKTASRSLSVIAKLLVHKRSDIHMSVSTVIEKTTTKLTFLRHHRHRRGLVRCHGNDPYNSVALTHRPGKHGAVQTTKYNTLSLTVNTARHTVHLTVAQLRDTVCLTFATTQLSTPANSHCSTSDTSTTGHCN